MRSIKCQYSQDGLYYSMTLPSNGSFLRTVRPFGVVFLVVFLGAFDGVVLVAFFLPRDTRLDLSTVSF